MHKYGALVNTLHADGQHAAARVIAKLSQQADAADKLNEVIVRMQKWSTAYLGGHRIGQQEFIEGIIGILDGEQQREAQAAYKDSKK